MSRGALSFASSGERHDHECCVVPPRQGGYPLFAPLKAAAFRGLSAGRFVECAENDPPYDSNHTEDQLLIDLAHRTNGSAGEKKAFAARIERSEQQIRTFG